MNRSVLKMNVDLQCKIDDLRKELKKMKGVSDQKEQLDFSDVKEQPFSDVKLPSL